MEVGAVQKFKEYNRLCKDCPTRLQPKISTLQAMIMGLPVDDRTELLANVAKRIEKQPTQEDCGVTMTQTPEDVYTFQTKVNSKNRTIWEDREFSKNEKTMDESTKFADGERTEKTRKKFSKNKMEVFRSQQLIDYTELLLSGDKDAPIPKTVIDSFDDHHLDELRTMSNAELKLQQLKYLANKAKCEQNIAKYRVKLYEDSLKL